MAYPDFETLNTHCDPCTAKVLGLELWSLVRPSAKDRLYVIHLEVVPC
jgi:hypothetical protein